MRRARRQRLQRRRVAESREADRRHQRGDERGNCRDRDEANAVPGPERHRRDREARELLRLAVVDSQRGRVEEQGQDRSVDRVEAVDPALLEPAHFVLGNAGSAGRSGDGQLPAQARRGQDRAVVPLKVK